MADLLGIIIGSSVFLLCREEGYPEIKNDPGIYCDLLDASKRTGRHMHHQTYASIYRATSHPK